MLYLKLLQSFLIVGALSFGGGYAAIPLIQNQIVEVNGWMTLAEFTDLVAISQMTPGPLALNAATFVGLQLAGLPGALLCTLGCILPPCLIVSLLAWVYQHYQNAFWIQGALGALRPTVVAFILSAGLSILWMAVWKGGDGPVFQSIDFMALLLFGGSLFLLRKCKASPLTVILLCGLVGGCFYSFTGG